MTYVVKWGREKIRFPLPQPNTPLSELRKEIADYTHLPTESFKLVHAGAVMKDDNAPILAYGIHDGSTISIIGGDTSEKDRHPHRQSEKSAPPERRTEQSTIAQIQSEMDNVRGSLLPGVDRLIAGLKALTSSTSKQEHARLGELLLQSLLRLDAINSEGEWTEARKERKGAVKEVQGLLDRLDLAWRTAKGRT
ncbi:hypothetical protein PUNSTDRAFT_99317 [Punctularia strigosozonata HHB-11173 SS5]|uniref:uncharacterized protein n=1 Tax=Punctularia strigosozonata (strain HHB-11173) TaxID=741275 RepID=UPI0004418314|nr:uncharacterized protein PUNSTDRAFT_99317 [Punctularia strigosozonata HHB-11173 SS5]EIN11959.1 hypothetical protein PUNSTDRAFT_99317 [Punctularia strigosozonata HHB-11173 SS5]